jgi:hypothetical protein
MHAGVIMRVVQEGSVAHTCGVKVDRVGWLAGWLVGWLAVRIKFVLGLNQLSDGVSQICTE